MKEQNRNTAQHLMQLQNIDVSRYDQSFLDKSLQKRLTATQCHSVDDYLDLLGKDHDEAIQFFHSLHISYSQFFRNSLTFSVLERIILPSLIQQKKNTRRKEIRIWSAACAAGQESYSLAMLVEELKHTGNETFNYRIFATDLSESQIDQAKKGEYPAEALQNVTMKRVAQWFTSHGESYTVKPELREHIDFSVFDLFSELLSSPPASIFGDFDVVVCANLLFYYKPEYRQALLEKTSSCLSDGGFLVVGEAERDILMNTNYREVFPQSGIFQKKIER